MDHHCPWLGNCIGSQNHKYFITFLYNSFWGTSAIVYTTYDYFFTKDRAIFWHRWDFFIVITLSSCMMYAVTLMGAFNIYFLLNHTCTIEADKLHHGFNPFSHLTKKTLTQSRFSTKKDYFRNVADFMGTDWSWWLFPSKPQSAVDGYQWKMYAQQ